MVLFISTRNKSVYIPSLDGKDIMLANNYIDGSKKEYSLRLKDGEHNLRRYINSLDYSLDLIKLREIYPKVYRRKDFSFFIKQKEYTPRVMNVTFKYSVKEFNKTKPDTYIRYGYKVDDKKFKDCVYVVNNKLVGIQISKEVKNPISQDLLGSYFYYQDGTYHVRTNIKTVKPVADIRRELYSDGFTCDGVKYIRFKRSSGSSRVGKCLFIDEKLYPRMHKWEMCGIKIKSGDDVDLASLEAYISLTLSSIIDTIDIQPENILVIDDWKSVFLEKAAATRIVDGKLSTKPEEVEVSNSIWDGQSLMDVSLFGKYQRRGMLLLRTRFFKSCCFNANIQQWFKDNGITDISQLNGKTRATNIEDIKFITTPSSIKYLKFGTLDQWFDNLEPTFGIVKYDKPTKYFNGRMVSTHYQLINTLQMTKDEVRELVAPSLDYLGKIKTDPTFLRYQIKYAYQDSDKMSGNAELKNDIIYKMLGINDDFAKTKIYHKFRDNLVKSMLKELRCGHILVNGNYSVLCGNPIEMLQYAIGKFTGEQVIQKGTLHSTRFDNGVDLLGSRSPHVTIANVLLAKNIWYDDIEKYMNPTKEIVYINSIGENILERLSGAD